MLAYLKGNKYVQWAVAAFVVVAVVGGVLILARAVFRMAGTTLVEASDNGAHAVGNAFTIPAWAYRGHHRVLGKRMCFYPEVSWGQGCKLDPNATPNDSSRPQDDGSDDPNYCPRFGIYTTFPLGDGRCKLQTLGAPETAVVPDGWVVTYWTGSPPPVEAKAGETITTTEGTFSKVP